MKFDKVDEILLESLVVFIELCRDNGNLDDEMNAIYYEIDDDEEVDFDRDYTKELYLYTIKDCKANIEKARAVKARLYNIQSTLVGAVELDLIQPFMSITTKYIEHYFEGVE